MMVRRWLFIALLMATFGLIWLALTANQDENNRLLARLNQLYALNVQVNEEVGRSYIGIASNYDHLIEQVRLLSAEADGFIADAQRLDGSAGYLDRLKQAVADKKQQVEDFKYRNSIVRLTWHHYPTLGATTLELLQRDTTARSAELESLVKNLIIATSLYVNSNQNQTAVKDSLESLKQWSGDYGEADSNLKLLMRYSEKTLEYSVLLETLTQGIYEHPLQGRLGQVERFIVKQQASSEQRVKLLRIAALLGAIFLSAIVVYLVRGFSRASSELSKSEQQVDFQQYVLNEHAMVSIIDRNGIIRQVSDRLCEVLGYQPEEVVGQPRTIFFSTKHDKAFYKEAWEYINTGQVWNGEVCLDCKNGDHFWSMTTIIPKKDQKGDISEFIFIRTDISKLKRAEAEISVLARLPEENPEAVLRVDKDNTVLYANKPADYLLEHWETAIGKLVPETWCLLFDDLRRTGRNQEVEVECAGRCFLLLIIPVKDTPYINIYSRDITARKKAEKELAYMAYHDDLTGLINRGAFEQELEAAVLSAANGTIVHCLMYIDLNQFKIVNDTCGHVAGDELLKQVSRILIDTVRNSDVVGRLGGDEFGVILWGCDVDAAMGVAEKIVSLMQGFRFTWDDLFFDVGASIGIVKVDNSGGGLEDLMGKADVACYSAKEATSSHIHLYQEQVSEASARHSEMRWVSRIPRALENDQFCLFTQPILALKEDDPRPRYEVLVRLRDDDGEFVPPGAFLPAAERFKQITLIDSCVIRKIFEFMAQNADYMARHKPIFCINLSGTSLGDQEILELVTKCCETYPEYMQYLHFEITETSAVKDFTITSSFIEKFLILGCDGISLDDFGSGMSSFAYLQQLPVDAVKIDGSFVRDMANNEVNQSIVQSVHAIGHALGMETVAEWVEDTETISMLKKIGVDYIQGYVVSAPFPIEALITRKSWDEFREVIKQDKLLPKSALNQ
ncbi:EAL domain-containing protein [bacterium SCSIO 12696]|nr:EAL domain-containing protein [bacterium SCSIO 12696]